MLAASTLHYALQAADGEEGTCRVSIYSGRRWQWREVWLRLTAVEMVAIGRLKTLEGPVKLVSASGPGAYAHPNKSDAKESRARVSAVFVIVTC